jgi:hypothetical protein
MRLCHEPRRGWTSTAEEPAICEVGRPESHPLAMDKRRPSLTGDVIEEDLSRGTWTWQGTDAFLGLQRARGRPSTSHEASALIQKGDWCGSVRLRYR